ncbi:iron-sulfur cluster biosynthesis family protein, partial [Acinetobacter baumannii]|uniref:iron-sulfur cluster biosynthesis family protein n=1 Tax=Acinetobacter baumannii TaxID=470 RepID=UPI0008DCC4C2
HISNYFKNRGKGEGICVGVKTSGCTVLAYFLEYLDDIDAHEQLVEQFVDKVFVYPKSLVHLDGLEMDYVKHGINEGFVFNNP